MNLVESINLHWFGILHLLKKSYPCRSQDFTTDTPAVSTENETCAFQKEDKGGMEK